MSVSTLQHDDVIDTETDPIDIVRPHWLIATGDAGRIEVLRSLQLRETSPMFAPVKDYIDRHGLVLAARETFEDDNWFLCRVEMSVYVPASPVVTSYVGVAA